MIHGHIDFVSRTRVEGWMHSERVSLVGAHLLAFIDDAPVGGGDIGIFREDLQKAGIGDGRGGFRFPIELKPSHDPRLLDVRLEGSNALIRQAHTRLIARDDLGIGAQRAPPSADTLNWMRARGWLTADEHAVLDRLGRFGAYRQPLPPPLAGRGVPLPDAARGTPRAFEHIAVLAGQFLELHLQRRIRVHIHEEIRENNLPSLRAHLHMTYPSAAPVIGLWAPWTCCLNVSEGSHSTPKLFEPISGVDYEFGEDHLLWLNLDTNFNVPTGGFLSPAIAFVPKPV